MSAQAENNSAILDSLKWLIAIAIVVGAIWGNQYFADIPSAYRLLGVSAAGLLAVWVFFSTAKGRVFRQFSHEARIEIRKVVWPSRQETVQTTMIVIAFTVVVALILWGIDAVLGSLVEWIMKLGG